MIKRCITALQTRAYGIGWSLASAVIGALIGVGVATLWGRTVGW